jgi:transposase-like protein
MMPPMGSGGKVVEADETFIGHVAGTPKKGMYGWSNKNVVFTLVERGGSARSFHVDGVSAGDLLPIVRRNVSKEASLHTDEAQTYKYIAEFGEVAKHETVNHSKDEYVRYPNVVRFPDGKPDPIITTNTVEGFYSIFKRGMKGIYQHCSEKHLHRYLSEFDFRYSNRIATGYDDVARAEKALKGVRGKRLTYRTTNHG